MKNLSKGTSQKWRNILQIIFQERTKKIKNQGHTKKNKGPKIAKILLFSKGEQNKNKNTIFNNI